MSACEDGRCVDSPQPIGTKCRSGNFSGVCDEEQRCVPCVDDADDFDVDSGCPKTAPECDDSGDVPECVGCTKDADCDDGVDCTADTCDDGRCLRALLPAGAECPDGVCNGAGASDSCVPCVDNHATGLDAGCDAASPICDTTQSPPACVECLDDEDCDDDNECTVEACSSRRCVFQTAPAGEPCVGGVCSGVPGAESCGVCLDTEAGDGVDQGCTEGAPVCDMEQVPPACTGCSTHDDCDDGFECTTDTCNDSKVCVYETNDSLCESTGDVCMPNKCVAGTGCTPVDVTQELQLLADAAFDSGGNAWEESSSSDPPVQLILLEGSYGSTVLADTPTRYAWLGGLLGEVSELTQTVTLPEGSQSLTLKFKYYLDSDYLPYYDDYNTMGVQLRSADGNALLHEFQRFGNQDANNYWADFAGTIDVTEWAGTDVQLYFWAAIGDGIYYYYDYPYYDYMAVGISSFFVDTTSLTATVCE